MTLLIDAMFMLVIWIYFVIIERRDSRDRARFAQIGKQLDKEEARRIKEEKLRKVRRPGVLYLDDYKRTSPQQPA